MLIENFVGAVRAQFIQRTFGFGPAKSHSVRIGMLRRLLALAALLESFQVDQIPHAFLPSPSKESTGGIDTSELMLRVEFCRHRRKSP
jgi:hypothetical protein